MRRHFTLSLLFAAALLLIACGGGGGGGATTSTGGGSSSGVTLGVVSSANASANQTTVVKPGTTAGAAYIWGDNTWGQIGDGTQNSPKPTPTAIGGSATWKAVAAGGSHTLAIKSDGTLWAWGLCVNGQLGLGVNGASCFRTVPTKVGTATDWQVIAAGDKHSLGIQGGTKVMAWGQNSSGQLGVAGGTGTTCPANTQDQTAPVQVRCFYANGTTTSPTITLPTTPTAVTWRTVAAGANHSLALRSDGLLYSWGSDSTGQLGQLSTLNAGLPTGVYQFAGFSYVIAVSAGAGHTLAIEQGGNIFSWGDNTNGQLGRLLVSPNTSSSIPDVVTGGPWIAIAAGGSHSLAIRQSDLTLWAWGRNNYGQLGDGSTTDAAAPVQVGGTTRFNKVSAGQDHSVAIDTNGNLWVWGRNDSGQLGTGTTSAPVLVPTLLP